MNKKLKEKMLKSITSKNAVKQAIINKGIDVGDDFSTYASAIDSIQSGGGSTGDGKYRIRYLDIDGTILKEEYLNEGDSLTPPDNPSYDSDYLVFDSWNYDIESVVVDRDYDIGAIYNTIDDCTYMFCRFTTNTGLSPNLKLNGYLTIDWGDGTVDTNLSHTYASEGEYVIKITGRHGFNTNSSVYLLGSSDLNKALQKAYLGNVIDVGSSAFSTCYSLQNVSIPNSVQSINLRAFYSCSSLKNINIPNGITSIDTYTFSNCRSFQSVSIPNGVTSIGEYTFQNCYSLQNICLPNSVKSIDNNVFTECYSLTSVSIPNSVTSIGDHLFYNCSSLKNINIPNGITSIDTYTFYHCYALQSILIPKSVTSISSYVFSYCYSLKNVIIPNGVTSISNNAFQNCYSLINCFILCDQVPTLSGTNAFSSINKGCVMWVNDSIIEDLKVATNWSSFASYMKRLSECPQYLLEENGIERPEPLPEPSGYTVHFEQTGMYGVGGEWSFDGITWFSLEMNDTYAPKTVENVTKVKLKISNNYMSAEWSDDSGNVILSDIGESDFITLTKDTTFSFNHWD